MTQRSRMLKLHEVLQLGVGRARRGCFPVLGQGLRGSPETGEVNVGGFVGHGGCLSAAWL